MTEDLLRTTAIIHALVVLLTDPDHDVSDPHVRIGFDAALDHFATAAEKASLAEAPRQAAALASLREHGATLFTATGDAVPAAMEALAQDFMALADTVPGYHGV